MKERPILFSGEMVRAILDGRKTQTRRVVKPQPPAECSIHYMLGKESWLPPEKQSPIRHTWEAWHGPLFQNRPEKYLCGVHDVTSPYGGVGDRLWVRENGWEPCAPSIGQIAAGADTWPRYEYDADGVTEANAEDFKAWGWKRRPSIHMPRWASRITLEITGVRVERLQTISEDDAVAEGRPRHTKPPESISTVEMFATSWNRLNEKRGYGWDANPWVWVLEFRRVDVAAVVAA